MSAIELPGEIEVFVVKHLPVVRSYVGKLGVVELLNELVESEMDVEPGLLFLGMLLDTLSGRRPLYRLEEFFETQDTELLLGKPIRAKSFHDDNVGRFLDKLAETKPTRNRPGTSYRAYETDGELYGKRYRALVVHSSAHDRRRQKRIERELEAEHKSLQTELKKACKIDYACRTDAEAAAERIARAKANYSSITAQIEEHPRSKRGRPKGGGEGSG